MRGIQINALFNIVLVYKLITLSLICNPKNQASVQVYGTGILDY